MKINTQTKISTIIKHNKEAIDVIAAINPHFEKLKNPILRKVLAPRVTIADAARIGKCKVDDFLNALSKIGFEIEIITPKPKQADKGNPTIMQSISSGKIKTLDVRPVLQQGTDPFQHIMDAIKILPDGFVLEVINSFEPTPLIKILNKKGYPSTVRSQDGVVKTYFINGTEETGQDIDDGKRVFNIAIEKLEAEKARFNNKCKEIDVRDLEMPLPMVTILKELEELPEGHALYINHKKVPQYLLPELAERKLITWISEIEEGNVKLLIHN